MSEIKYEERTKHGRGIKLTKDTSTFGGPNMWNLHVETAKGNWEKVQWMDVSKAERILGEDLPRYRESSTVERAR